MNIEILWTPEGGRLVVTLPDYGTLIRCELATDTFVESIKRIGIERVKALEIEIGDVPLISMMAHPDVAQRKVDGYYIRMGMSPEDMATKLKQIAAQLNISLYAELFPSTGG